MKWRGEDDNPPTTLRHSRESGNLEAAIRYIGPFYYGTAATDSRFRGNDEE